MSQGQGRPIGPDPGSDPSEIANRRIRRALDHVAEISGPGAGPERIDLVIAQLEDALGGHNEPVAVDERLAATALANLLHLRRRRFAASGRIEHLEAAEAAAGLIASAGHDLGDPWVAALSHLGLVYHDLWRATRNPDQLDRAVDMGRISVAVAPEGSSECAVALSNLGASLRTRFDLLSRADDLDEAILALEDGAAAMPWSHPAAVLCRSNLVSALLSRYEREGLEDDLARAVQLGEDVLGHCGPLDPHRTILLSNAATALVQRFDRHGDLVALDGAIVYLEEAAATTAAPSPAVLTNLGLAYVARFEERNNPADLDLAIERERQARLLARFIDEQVATATNLAVALQTRFEITGRTADLDEAIETLDTAISLGIANKHDELLCRLNLAAAHHARFTRAGDLADLERAIGISTGCLDEVGPGEPVRITLLANTALMFGSSYSRLGREDDLEHAVALGRQAVASLPQDHPDQTLYRSNLAETLRLRFELRGEATDIDEAIEAAAGAVERTSATHIDHALHLTNLAVALLARFDRTGSLSDLADALDASVRSVDETAADHPDRPRRLAQLALIERTRFERTGDSACLAAAIAASEEAVRLTPRDHPGRAGHLCSLSAALVTRHRRFPDTSLLDRAVSATAEAMQAISSDDHHRARILMNHALTLRARATATGSGADLDASIEADEDALALLDSGHSDRVAILSNLSFSLRARHALTGELTDLDRAIDRARDAVDHTPNDEPDRAGYLWNLGAALQERHASDDGGPHLTQATAAFREAAELATAPPHLRAVTARLWGRAAATAGRWEEAVTAYSHAIEQVGLLGFRDLGRSDQEHRLTDFAGLGPDAAAACIQLGWLDQAVSLLEAGRANLFSQVLDIRTDLTALRDASPGMALRFTGLRDEIERRSQAPMLQLPDQGGPDDSAVRRGLAAELDVLLNQIRALDGFENFLLPPPISQLLSVGDRGPVVMLNTSVHRCDALVVTTNGVSHVPLPDLELADLTDRVRTFWDAIAATTSPLTSPEDRKAADGHQVAALEWLWTTTAGPVLEHLLPNRSGAAGTGGAGGTHCWWCPTGPLTLLPVHAAGRHSTRFDPEPHTVVDRVVSSYTPTLRALLHARRPGADTPVRLLVVAAPDVEGATSLPGARTEAEHLRARTEIPVQLIGGRAGEVIRRDEVLAALSEHIWVHFACHGRNDFDDPGRSALVLGGNDGLLTVLDLMSADLAGAELAFLAACTTARQGTELLDEPVHLAAACQLAGFRQVIAALWPIDDADALRLTQRFYDRVLTEPSASASTALHEAMLRLRTIHPRRPTRWAPYVHFGRS